MKSGMMKYKMDLKEINEFIEEEIKKLEFYYNEKDNQELSMAMGFKVIEEIGELFEEILMHKGYQRKDKLDKFDHEGIKKEFADVIFTILILAKRFDVDIEDAIKIKMQELKKRDYNK
jgi:NTP pyrophosphatase (non-canonical NTP hydrolase)